MKKDIALIAAPTAIQPGGYVPVAYAERSVPLTAKAELEVARQGDGWAVVLSWACSEPVDSIAAETDRFVDACAILAPSVADAPWITMGETGKGVEGLLWRADQAAPQRIEATGLGSVSRLPAPAGSRVDARWQDGRWRVEMTLPAWPALAGQRQIAVAIWRGAVAERAGLKSVSPGWMAVE